MQLRVTWTAAENLGDRRCGRHYVTRAFASSLVSPPRPRLAVGKLDYPLGVQDESAAD